MVSEESQEQSCLALQDLVECICFVMLACILLHPRKLRQRTRWQAYLPLSTVGRMQDIVYSFPVECKDGKWSIVQGLQIDGYSAGKLKATGDELVEEKALALQCLAEAS